MRDFASMKIVSKSSKSLANQSESLDKFNFSSSQQFWVRSPGSGMLIRIRGRINEDEEDKNNNKPKVKPTKNSKDLRKNVSAQIRAWPRRFVVFKRVSMITKVFVVYIFCLSMEQIVMLPIKLVNTLKTNFQIIAEKNRWQLTELCRFSSDISSE